MDIPLATSNLRAYNALQFDGNTDSWLLIGAISVRNKHARLWLTPLSPIGLNITMQTTPQETLPYTSTHGSVRYAYRWITQSTESLTQFSSAGNPFSALTLAGPALDLMHYKLTNYLVRCWTNVYWMCWNKFLYQWWFFIILFKFKSIPELTGVHWADSNTVSMLLIFYHHNFLHLF